MKTSLAISTLLHAAILALFLFPFSGRRDAFPPNENPTEGKIIPKTIQVVDLVEARALTNPQGDVEAKPKVAPKPSPSPRKCEHSWYGGIGVEIVGSRVLEAVAGYPASLAGVMPDDEVVSPRQGEIRGDPGTTVRLEVIRAGRKLSFEIVRDRICY